MTQNAANLNAGNWASTKRVSFDILLRSWDLRWRRV